MFLPNLQLALTMQCLHFQSSKLFSVTRISSCRLRADSAQHHAITASSDNGPHDIRLLWSLTNLGFRRIPPPKLKMISNIPMHNPITYPMDGVKTILTYIDHQIPMSRPMPRVTVIPYHTICCTIFGAQSATQRFLPILLGGPCLPPIRFRFWHAFP